MEAKRRAVPRHRLPGLSNRPALTGTRHGALATEVLHARLMAEMIGVPCRGSVSSVQRTP